MIDQLWYTSSAVGLGMSDGFRVRAASANLQDLRSERFASLDPYLFYRLPQGASPVTTRPEEAPVCLAFLETDRKERILLYKTFAGNDRGRPGNYFIHLLAGLPSTFSAREAIECWEASFWCRSDQSLANPVETELAGFDPKRLTSAPGMLNMSSLQRTELQDDLQFVIQAFLDRKPEQRIFIAAPHADVAALIWGLTHCLPKKLLVGVTFSTYEQDVTKAPNLIVGTCFAPTSVHGQGSVGSDLPLTCYEGQGLAVNCYAYSRKRSALTKDNIAAEFAQFAASCLITGTMDKLNYLLSIAEKWNFSDVVEFLLRSHLFLTDDRQKQLSLEQITKLLQIPDIAEELLKRESIQRTIIDFSLNDLKWWQGQGKPALTKLCAAAQNAPSLRQCLQQFAEKVFDQVLEAIKNNVPEPASLALGGLGAALLLACRRRK